MKNFALLIFLASLGLITARVEAQTPPDMQDKIVTSCANYFKNIQSLGYSVKGTWKPGAAFAKYTGEDPTKFAGSAFIWKYVGFQKKFRVDVATYDSSGVLKERNSVAFDGETFQDLMSGGTLDLTKKARPDLSELTLFVGMKSMFFAPFWFVQPNALSSLYHVDHPSAYQDRQLVANFMSKATPLAVDPAAPAVLRFQETYHFNKSVLPAWNIPDHCSITVTFSPENGFWYPTAWEIASAERGVLVRYEVRKMAVVKSGDGAEYPYPQEAVLGDFGRGYKKKSSYPDPIQETTYTVEGLVVNPKESLELQCMIDPAEAQNIYYQDKNAFITVPH